MRSNLKATLSILSCWMIGMIVLSALGAGFYWLVKLSGSVHVAGALVLALVFISVIATLLGCFIVHCVTGDEW